MTPDTEDGGNGETAWEIVLELPGPEHVQTFEDALSVFADTVASFEIEGTTRWRVSGYSEDEPDAEMVRARVADVAGEAGIPVPAVSVARSRDIDWVAEVERTLAPIHVPPFYVYGSHVTEPPPAGAIPIRIDAGLAFGTGNHETTRGCLAAIERLYGDFGGSGSVKAGAVLPPPARILDVGTGSGILAIAAAKRFAREITASDIDPIAVDVARTNAEINGVAEFVQPFACPGLDDPEIEAAGPFDLIFANIVANPLIEIAPDLSAALAQTDNARAVLSGILDIQKDDVTAAYAVFGLTVVDALPMREWVTLVLARR